MPGLGKPQLWFVFNAADWDDLRRLAPIPQHDRVGFVGGDALDHAAPIGPVNLAGRLLILLGACCS